MKIINDVIEYLIGALLFINPILYAYSYLKGNKSKAIKYLVIYLTFSFCFAVAMEIIIIFHEQLNIIKNNLFLTHYFFIFQFIFLSLFYNQLFTKKQKKYQIIITILGFLILFVQYALNRDLYYKFNLLEILITSLPLVVYSIFHLYNSLSKSGKYMYINAGILIYLSVSTLIFILGNLLITIDISLASHMWILNRLFYTIYLALFLIEWKKSLWKTKN